MRDAGYYWVKLSAEDDWQPAEWDVDQQWWWVIGDDVPRGISEANAAPEVIGERIRAGQVTDAENEP
jgi:hypothetical protein